MKKIKLLSGIAGLTALSVGLVPAISSCSSTGLQVEMISKLKERSFNKKTGGSTWTFKINDAKAGTNIKVKLVNLKVDGADTPLVSGLIKYSCDSAGNIKVTVKTNTLLTQWPNATKFEFGFEFINKETNQTTTLDGFNLSINESVASVNFCECDWSIIINKANAYEAGTLTEADFFASFTTDGATAITSWDDFIGLECSVTINTKAHKVRVIDTNHDIIAAGQTNADKLAVFTFELVTLLSDTNGQSIKSIWDSTAKHNWDYTNSVLRWNLNHTGTQPSSGAWDDSALSMLPEELRSNIKIVQKHVATSTDSGSTYTVNNYNDKLFPLSYTEMAQSGAEKAKVEGTPYQYWINNDKKSQPNSGRTKTDFEANKNYVYWLVSPYAGNDNDYHVWIVSEEGYIGNGSDMDAPSRPVSFAFCI